MGMILGGIRAAIPAMKCIPTCIVTGAASGIGAAVAELLAADGWRVIGVDLHDAEVLADLSEPAGRDRMVSAVEATSGGFLDAVVSCAGLSDQTPRTLAVNYFGAIG